MSSSGLIWAICKSAPRSRHASTPPVRSTRRLPIRMQTSALACRRLLYTNARRGGGGVMIPTTAATSERTNNRPVMRQIPPTKNTTRYLTDFFTRTFYLYKWHPKENESATSVRTRLKDTYILRRPILYFNKAVKRPETPPPVLPPGKLL